MPQTQVAIESKCTICHQTFSSRTQLKKHTVNGDKGICQSNLNEKKKQEEEKKRKNNEQTKISEEDNVKTKKRKIQQEITGPTETRQKKEKKKDKKKDEEKDKKAKKSSTTPTEALHNIGDDWEEGMDEDEVEKGDDEEFYSLVSEIGQRFLDSNETKTFMSTADDYMEEKKESDDAITKKVDVGKKLGEMTDMLRENLTNIAENPPFVRYAGTSRGQEVWRATALVLVQKFMYSQRSWKEHNKHHTKLNGVGLTLASAGAYHEKTLACLACGMQKAKSAEHTAW
jgi:hypothetical protein